MTLPLLKTPAAARDLSVPYTTLMSLIRYGKIPAPRKDTSGDYLWAVADLEAARRALAQRSVQGEGSDAPPPFAEGPRDSDGPSGEARTSD